MRRAKLAEARKGLGKSQEDVAEELEVHRTQVSQWERGEATPHPKLRAAYADSLGVTLSELHAMLSRLPADETDMPMPLKITLAVEQAATEIYSHIANVVHGLLQTPAYAAAIARAVGTTPTSEDYVQRNIEQRAHRQQRVLNGDVSLHVLQPEAALRWRLESVL
jgi:transcriptional regulator with XRE-family HTH domain